jgi:hypothetical protein
LGEIGQLGCFQGPFVRDEAIYRVQVSAICDIKTRRWVNICYYHAVKMTVGSAFAQGNRMNGSNAKEKS